MRSLILPLLLIGSFAMLSCQSWFHPRTTQEKNVLGLEIDGPGEKDIMGLRFGGIGIGSSPSELSKFSQVKKITPPPQEGMLVYQVYNPNANISMFIAWYQTNRMKQMEMRYLDAQGVATLSNSGGWQGIESFLTEKFGPPSMVGSNVPIVATQAGLNPTNAVFNGTWIFSRVNRQLNYLAYTNMGFISLIEPKPTDKNGKVIKKKKSKPTPTPSDNPGLSI